eukprot:jgi/Tetstr1/449112/TSEL_036324.t1
MDEVSSVGAWLEEAGLGRYGGAFAGMADDAFRCLLMQDYSKFGVTSMEDKQTLYRLIKKISDASRAENAAAAAAEMPKPPAGAKQAAAGLSVDGHAAAECMQAVNMYGNACMLDASAGLLDLNDHDGDLLSPSNNFREDGGLSGQVSPSMEPLADGFLYPPSSRPQHLPPHAGAPPAAEAPLAQVDPNPPKIRVVVRKRPLNGKENERADEDTVDVLGPDHMQCQQQNRPSADKPGEKAGKMAEGLRNRGSWRQGLNGERNLCNACGVKFRKGHLNHKRLVAGSAAQ